MKFFSRQDKPLRIKLPFFDRIILYFAPIAIIILAITLHISISQYRIGQIENAENVLSEMTVNVAS
ncbi:MAG: hypothetical protein K6E13_07755, partial [Lachnospiraceae bacterium]|nr:hypothetical protein [Lachnospiraceae bacterium]